MRVRWWQHSPAHTVTVTAAQGCHTRSLLGNFNEARRALSLLIFVSSVRFPAAALMIIIRRIDCLALSAGPLLAVTAEDREKKSVARRAQPSWTHARTPFDSFPIFGVDLTLFFRPRVVVTCFYSTGDRTNKCCNPTETTRFALSLLKV